MMPSSSTTFPPKHREPTWSPVTDFGRHFGPSEHRYWSHTGFVM